MNGEEIELDGECGNRPACNLLFVCENFHCLNAFLCSCRIVCIGVVTYCVLQSGKLKPVPIHRIILQSALAN